MRIDDKPHHRNDDLLGKLTVGELKLNPPPWRARCGEVYYIPSIGLYDTDEIHAGENPHLDEEMYIKGFMCRTILEASELSRVFSDLALKMKED